MKAGVACQNRDLHYAVHSSARDYVMEPLDQTSGFKATDGVLDGHDQAADERAHAPVVAQPIGFRERYVLSCPLHVHFRWWIWDRPSDVQYGCARFDWLLTRLEGGTSGPCFDGAKDTHAGIEYQDGAVFVDVVQFADDPEGIRDRDTGSLSYGCERWISAISMLPGVKIPINLWNPGLSVSFVGLSKMGNWTLRRICLSVQRGFTIAYTM